MAKQRTDDELEQIAMKNAIENFKKNKEKKLESVDSDNIPNFNSPKPTDTAPKTNLDLESYEQMGSQQTDPDLIVGHEIVKLPSKGMFYPDGLSEVKVEYLTARDEDILTTPSLIQSGEALDMIMKKKIKTPNLDVNKLLVGDQNAIALFLRASSYGSDYQVQVTDPRNGKEFPFTVDLKSIGYKEITEKPDKDGLFQFFLPMRKKKIKFRMLNAADSKKIIADVEHMQEAGYTQVAEFTSRKIKAHIVEIDGNSDRGYIDNFVNAMPAGDALKLRRKILDVTPDLDLLYEFTCSDGYKFKAPLVMGIDFFFPSL